MSKVSVFVAAAFFSAMILAGGALAQDVDAQVPVLVNVDADVRIDPPAAGGTGAVGGVTGGAEQIFNIKLAAVESGVSHRTQNRANSGAWVSHNRENVTLNLYSQQYRDAAVSLYSLNGKRILNGKASASNGAARISRANIPAGVYLLSVKGTKGNSFTARLTHSGSILNINAVFTADSPLLRKSAADDGYGEWTITVTAAGYSTITRTFTPVEGLNPRQDFTLTIIPGALLGDTTIINLKGTTADFTGNNVNIIEQDPYYGTIVEITGSGTYLVQGTLNKGFVAVSKKDLDVTVILKDAHITSPNYAPLVCLKKSDVTVILATNSTNTLADGGQDAADGKYGFGYDPDEQPNAALLIRRNLTIKGTGKLNVTAKCNNGIGSRASLKIEGGEITVSAPNNALKGNDAVTIAGGTLNLTSGEDGIKTEERDEGLGAVTVTGGSITITAGKDGIDASTDLNISNAAFKVKTGGGSGASGTVATSAKGLKADSSITIFSGTFDIDSKDDAIHADKNVTVHDGAFTISTADDAIRATYNLTIHGGNIDITKCYEGLEGYNINLNGGFVKIKASDDGINISDTVKTTVTTPGGGRPGLVGPGQERAIDGVLTITGGEYYIESSGGDGVDSNGSIVMTGGTVVSFSPSATNSPEVPVDFDGSFTMSGGLFIALGNAGNMLQLPNVAADASANPQYSFLAKFSSSPVAANTFINVSSNSGTHVVTLKTLGQTRSLMVCSPLLEKGTYTIFSGGTHTGAADNLGLYQGGAYSGGTAVKTVTINSTTTTVN